MIYKESAEQIALFKRAAYRPYRDATLRDYMFAIPNAGTRGGRRALLAGARRKAEGVKKGFPDIGVMEAVGPYHGMYVEMKKSKEDGGRPSDVTAEQHVVMDRLRSRGYHVVVCYGAEHAWKEITTYLGMKE